MSSLKSKLIKILILDRFNKKDKKDKNKIKKDFISRGLSN